MVTVEADGRPKDASRGVINVKVEKQECHFLFKDMLVNK